IWRDTPFTFFDESGNLVVKTGCDILRAEEQLGYVYQEEPAQVKEYCLPKFKIPYYVAGHIFIHPQDPLTALLDHLVVVVIPFDIESMSKLREAAAAGKKLALVLEGLEADAPVGAFFEIYLNLPSDVTNVDYKSIHYAGNLSFFGVEGDKHSHHGGAKRSFN